MLAAAVVALPAVADQAELVVLAAVETVETQTDQIRRGLRTKVRVAAVVAVIPVNLAAQRAVLASLLSVTLGRKFIPAALYRRQAETQFIRLTAPRHFTHTLLQPLLNILLLRAAAVVAVKLARIRAAAAVAQAVSCRELDCPSHRAHLIPSPLVPVAEAAPLRQAQTAQIHLFLLTGPPQLAAAAVAPETPAGHLREPLVDRAAVAWRQAVRVARAVLEPPAKEILAALRWSATHPPQVVAVLAQLVALIRAIRPARVASDRNGLPVRERTTLAVVAQARISGPVALVEPVAVQRVKIPLAVRVMLERQTLVVVVAVPAVKAVALLVALAVPA
jgi:hypothetical protein